MGTIEMAVKVDDMDVKVVSSGDSYFMDSGSVRLWCDGESQWVYSDDSREMTIVPYNPQGDDPVENPAAALNSSILKTYYIASEKDRCIILRARKNKRVSYPDMEVRVDQSNLPVSLKVTNTSGNSVMITIVRIKSLSGTDGVSFKPSDTLMESSVVTDLR